MRYHLIAASASLLVSAPCWAGPQDLAQCVAIDDDPARLACYDEIAGRASRHAAERAEPAAPPVAAAASAAAAPAVVASPPAPAAATTAASTTGPQQSEENFGLSAEQMKNTPERITAVVRSVGSQSHYGRWVVTLDNGQVWEQRETTPPAKRPKPGDVVTIEKSSFGSYMLVAPGRGSNRVKRVR
jgi:hypothetical protein